MNIQKIINYVMTTPENTNSRILGAELHNNFNTSGNFEIVDNYSNLDMVNENVEFVYLKNTYRNKINSSNIPIRNIFYINESSLQNITSDFIQIDISVLEEKWDSFLSIYKNNNEKWNYIALGVPGELDTIMILGQFVGTKGINNYSKLYLPIVNQNQIGFIFNILRPEIFNQAALNEFTSLGWERIDDNLYKAFLFYSPEEFHSIFDDKIMPPGIYQTYLSFDLVNDEYYFTNMFFEQKDENSLYSIIPVDIFSFSNNSNICTLAKGLYKRVQYELVEGGLYQKKNGIWTPYRGDN